MDRFDVLWDLALFSRPVGSLSEDLAAFNWDYDGEPFVVHVSQVKSVLGRFLAGELSGEELESWANLIECREDIAYEEEKHQEIENVIYSLANPDLEGPITVGRCKELLSSLR